MHVGRNMIATSLAGFVLLAAATAAAQTRPIVSIESDPNGTRYVRAVEQVYNAFTPARTIQNLASSPRINITNSRSTLVRNVTVRNARYGVYVSGAGLVSVDNFNYVDWNGEGSIYGGAIKIDRSTEVATYIQRVFADGLEAPDSTYARSNTDFIGIERTSRPVYIRYATGRNFGDAGIDAKSNVALMSVTIQGAHRGLRAWSGVTMTIANAIVNVPTGHEQVWIQGSAARVRYYNVLWCIGSTNPSPNDAACSTRPTAIGVDGISAAQAQQQVVALSANPLPSTSPFFTTHIDRVVVDYSSNGGATWRRMASGGAPGRPPYGDTRYRIPFSLASATYLFRVTFEGNGARVGSPTIVNEAGLSVSV